MDTFENTAANASSDCDATCLRANTESSGRTSPSHLTPADVANAVRMPIELAQPLTQAEQDELKADLGDHYMF
ncbi:hypothetical protein [Rhodoligotrophos ferricapiens]|uniref:hypothetical protein n=1 Tax=Rhodoligotrophos ferricapiens TaxID=3069264 RepID=UPI00315DD55E